MIWHRQINIILAIITMLGVSILPMRCAFADAIIIADSVIHSQQQQPLQATLLVTKPASASVLVAEANTAKYIQLNLSHPDHLTVKFEPIDANHGNIILSTSQPIKAPFVDVVLNIRIADTAIQLVKTLLLPQSNPKISNAPIPSNNLTQNLPSNNSYSASNLTAWQANNPQSMSTKKTLPSAKNNTHTINYTVKPNDSLWEIARKLAATHHVTITTMMNSIKAVNPLVFTDQNTTTIMVGSQIRLPINPKPVD